ncbi:MAG: cytochrome B6 [Solimonas sp.]
MKNALVLSCAVAAITAVLGIGAAIAAPATVPNSYAPVDDRESFDTVRARMEKAKPGVESQFKALLAERYDLSDKPIPGVVSSGRGKPVQGGVRAKLPKGTSWDQLAGMTPDEIKARGLWPAGFYPLPHENHPEGGMLFPQQQIDAIRKQEGRDLARFDLDFLLPAQFIPEFPPALYLTTRPDLGDVSKGQVVSLSNYYELFSGTLNPKQLEGLRLLLTPFAQQQFNATIDRRSLKPSQGVACFDCHVNGHTNAATHLVGDIRPQEHRHRIATPSLRGVNIQRLFGSQRALKTVEDFTEFEQRAAYFDGDPVIATKKGVNILERGSQVHFMGEFQALLDFPPAPKLDVFGKLDPARATQAELRGQDVFFGKGRCGECHTPPYYTDNTMHNLQVERFYKEKSILGMLASADGPIKTFPLRGIKDSAPYLHDDRLLTLDDTVEFFNLVLGTKLSEQEKKDVVSFLLTL